MSHIVGLVYRFMPTINLFTDDNVPRPAQCQLRALKHFVEVPTAEFMCFEEHYSIKTSLLIG